MMRSWANNQYSALRTLALLGCGSALMYAVALATYPLLRYLVTPTQNLALLVGSSGAARLALAAGVLLLFAQFAWGLRAVRAAQHQRLAARVIVGFALLFALLLLLVHPITSSDLYDYSFRGRMMARYAANTFVQSPQAFSADPLIQLIAWPHAVTAYGPLWEVISGSVARLAGEAPGVLNVGTPAPPATLLRLVLAYKLLDTLGFLLCGGAIWWVIRQLAPGQCTVALYLWLWNPFVLWESIGAGHNDCWMLLPVLLAVGLVSRLCQSPGEQAAGLHAAAPERTAVRAASLFSLGWPAARLPPPRSAGPQLYAGTLLHRPAVKAMTPAVHIGLTALILLTIGALIKYVPLLLGPVLLAAVGSRLPSWRQRWRLAGLAAVVCVSLIALAYAPFWRGWDTFHNFSDRRAIFTASWANGLRWLLLQAGLSTDLAQTIPALLALSLLLAGTAWAAWQAWQRPEAIVSHIFWLLLWSIVVGNPAPQPWYMLWPLAIALLQPWRSRLVLGVNLCACAALLSYVVSSFLIPMLG